MACNFRRNTIRQDIDGSVVVTIGLEAYRFNARELNGICSLNPAEETAPSISTQGSISPSSGPVGTAFTLTPPAVTGNPTPTVSRVVTLNGNPVTVTGNNYISTAPGALSVTWTANNGVGSPATSTRTATVTAVAQPAPVITRQPSITPSSATVGDSVTIDLGAATGAVGTPTWTLMRGATNVTSQVDPQMAIEFAVAGTYTLNVSWTNANGTTVATPVTITVAAAESVGLSAAAIHVPNTSSVATDLTLPLVAQGRLGTSFTETANGSVIQTSPRGIEFDGTNALMAGDIDISSGYYMAGVVTFNESVGNISVVSNLRTAGGHHLMVRKNGGALQVNWNYNAATNSTGGNMPAVVVGTPVVFGVEVDPVAGTVRMWNGTEFRTQPLNASGALETSILRLGRDHTANNLLNGALRNFTFETLAGQAISFEQALAELGAPVTPPFP